MVNLGTVAFLSDVSSPFIVVDVLTYPGSWMDPAEIMVDRTKAISCEQGPQETGSEGWWCVITCAPR